MKPLALIADDEPHLVDYLKARLAHLWPELAIAGTAANGPEALRQIDQTGANIAFLDIKMPGLTGLEVAARLNGQVHVVFTTAFDEYAVPAFEHEAVDYVLKPVTDARLAKTIERLKARFREEARPADLSALLTQLGVAVLRPERLRFIRAGAGAGNTVKQIAVEAVIFFDAQDKYTRVITEEGESLIRMTIRELTDALDPDTFVQVHRGTIVNLNCVATATRDDTGQVTLRMSGAAETIAVSRANAHLFKQM